MSAAPEVVLPQNSAERTGCWQGIPLGRPKCGKAFESSPGRLIMGDVSSSGDELNMKVRKPYTITKQRERWTEDEHQKFLEALKLYGRGWRRIEEHIGTKTAVQIRSHAQKFFSKLEREASHGSPAGKVQDIEIPPPRPKRKPSHPYPRKAGVNTSNSPSSMDEESLSSPSTHPGHPSMAGRSVQENIQSCQAKAFTPYISKGRHASGESILQDNARVLPHLFGLGGGLKLFGKTVVSPRSCKTDAQTELSEEEVHGGSLVKNGRASPVLQNKNSNGKHKEGFSAYVKVKKKLELKGISTLEDTDESNIEFPATEEESRVERQGGQGESDPTSEHLSRSQSSLDESEVQILSLGDGGATKETTNTLGFAQNLSGGNHFHHSNLVATNMDMQLSASGSPKNDATHLWMNSLFRYYGSLPVLPHTANIPTDGFLASPTIPWHFLHAAMAHPAAYAAAMAAAGWTGLVTGAQSTTGPTQILNGNNGHRVPTFLDDLSARAFTAAAASWWALNGTIPPGFTGPSGARSGCTDEPGHVDNMNVADSGVTSMTLVQNTGNIEDTIKQAQRQISYSETDDEAAASQNFSEPENADDEEHIARNDPSKGHCTADGRDCSSSLAPAPIETSMEDETFSPGCKSLGELDISVGVTGPAICTEEIEKSRITMNKVQQNLCSSADDIDGVNRISGTGSSSGSNTPIFTHNICDSETPNSSGSDAKGKDNANKKFETHDGNCELIHQEKLVKLRFKHAEKVKRQQHKDFRAGDDDARKRFKHCAHDMDLRKEVSQEGRKAFQALFNHKTLPQAFPSVGALEDVKILPKNLEQNLSIPSSCTEGTAVYDVEHVSCLLIRNEKDGGRCIEGCRSLSKAVNGEEITLKTGKGEKLLVSASSTSLAETETHVFSKFSNTKETVEFRSLSTSEEVAIKKFSISSRSGRSGFVPYQKPLAGTKAQIAIGISDGK